jgi:hypothetical protein
MLRGCAVLGLLLIVGTLAAANQVRVLVIGSDWSQQHHWPLMSALMAANSRPPVGVMLRSVAATGASLEQLAGAETTTRQLADGPWDLILLQVHPLAVAFEREDCLRALHRIAGAAEARRILIWHPPGPSVEPARRQAAETALEAVAQALGRERWRLDAAWQAALNLDLPIEDESGLPTQQGAYLLACALFAECTGRDPRQAITSIQHQALEPLWLPSATAERLQRAADLAVVE